MRRALALVLVALVVPAAPAEAAHTGECAGARAPPARAPDAESNATGASPRAWANLTGLNATAVLVRVNVTFPWGAEVATLVARVRSASPTWTAAEEREETMVSAFGDHRVRCFRFDAPASPYETYRVQSFEGELSGTLATRVSIEAWAL